MAACQMCGAPVTDVLDLGPQPICNRFAASAEAGEYRHPLSFGVCPACGLAQLTQWPPARELRPRVSWITYTEPEAHVARLAQTLAQLPGLTPDGLLLGISLKDDSVLDGLRALGFTHCYRLDEQADLAIEGAGAGVETVQAQLTVERARALVQRHGPAQLVVARHIVEHAHAVAGFVAALQTLVAPGGYVVLEAPDCQAAFDTRDYTTLWEEHTVYFTPATFQNLFPQAGLTLTAFNLVPYPFESSLTGIGRRLGAAPANGLTQAQAAVEVQRTLDFGRALPARAAQVRQFLAGAGARSGSVALLGAGHLGCAFINYLGLREYLAFAVDDNPHKQGLGLPGSRLPIRPSAALVDSGVQLCLLALNPSAEAKVVERNAAFVARGGAFVSIFPASPRALPLDPSPL